MMCGLECKKTKYVPVTCDDGTAELKSCGSTISVDECTAEGELGDITRGSCFAMCNITTCVTIAVASHKAAASGSGLSSTSLLAGLVALLAVCVALVELRKRQRRGKNLNKLSSARDQSDVLEASFSLAPALGPLSFAPEPAKATAASVPPASNCYDSDNDSVGEELYDDPEQSQTNSEKIDANALEGFESSSPGFEQAFAETAVDDGNDAYGQVNAFEGEARAGSMTSNHHQGMDLYDEPETDLYDEPDEYEGGDNGNDGYLEVSGDEEEELASSSSSSSEDDDE